MAKLKSADSSAGPSPARLCAGRAAEDQGADQAQYERKPLPASQKVFAAVKSAVNERFRLYPNPTAEKLRAKLASRHRCRPENIIIGTARTNCWRWRCGHSWSRRAAHRNRGAKSLVQMFTPGYSLYPVAGGHSRRGQKRGAVASGFLPAGGCRTPARAPVELCRSPDLRHHAMPRADAVTTTAELRALCAAQKGVVVLDEAYVDFARENAMELALKISHVLVAATFSKAYSLCYLRVGYFVGHPDLIAALDKIRDSYNVNRTRPVAALASAGMIGLLSAKLQADHRDSYPG